MLTRQEEILLTAIRDDPSDDVLRLAYADWLEEEGGRPNRAQFIRAQYELAELPPDHPERLPLIEFVDRLTSEDRLGVHVPPESITPDHPANWTLWGILREYERGFPTVAVTEWPELLDFLTTASDQGITGYPEEGLGGSSAAEFFLHAPTTTKLSIRAYGVTNWNLPYYVHDVVSSSPVLGRFTDLELGVFGRADGGPSEEPVATASRRLSHVLSGKHLVNVERLTLTDQRLSDDYLSPEVTRHIATFATERSRSLRTVRLAAIGLTPEALRPIADCPGLHRVRELDLAGNPLGNDGALRIAASPHFRNLRTLNVKGCGVTGFGLCALAELPNLVTLTGVEEGWFWARRHVNGLLERHKETRRD
jgi:uncharacterized protein (TIGR02996 family)